MAYQSAYAGSEIDQAVGEVQGRIWKPIMKSVQSSSWSSNSDEGHSASYKATVTVANCVASDCVPPMIWFVENTTNNRYYCDYETSISGTTYSITIYSNRNTVNGAVYIFGLYSTTESI